MKSKCNLCKDPNVNFFIYRIKDDRKKINSGKRNQVKWGETVQNGFVHLSRDPCFVKVIESEIIYPLLSTAQLAIASSSLTNNKAECLLLQI